MEEDIKTIKERLSIIESLCTDDCINKTTVIQPLKYAIENLIKEYKELEEKVNKVEDNYIEKSKVREYLNKMEKRCDKPKFSVMKKRN